jgi:hypothetical protein
MSADNSNESWRIPPELDQPLPRTVRLNGMGVTLCVSAAIIVLLGIRVAFRAIHDELSRQAENNSLAQELASRGRGEDATVTQLLTGLGYVARYQFTVDGRNYERGAFISKDHWQALDVGSTLPIHYLPSDPHQSAPDGDPPNSQNHWSDALGMAGMSLFFTLSFATVFLLPISPQRRLLARGSTARGIVTRCKAGSQGRSSGYFLDYEFPLPDGSMTQGRKFSGEQMAEGSAVAVLYDPDRPKNNSLYPLKTVKLAGT